MPPPQPDAGAHTAPPLIGKGAALPPPPPGIPGVATGTPLIPSTKDDRLWATLVHLGGVLGAFLAMAFIPGNVVVPLIIWLVKREGSAFINDQGKDALNFQITVTIAGAIAALLIWVCVGFFLLIAVGIFAFIFGIIAAVKANEGVAYRYPVTLRLIT